MEDQRRSRERESHPETTRHTIDPLFKPVKARLSRIEYPFFLTLFFNLSLSLSLFISLYKYKREMKIEKGRERWKMEGVRRPR